MIRKGLFDELLRGFTCHVLRAHDWKRAVRNGWTTTGTQRCRRCAASREVPLRRHAKSTQGAPQQYG